MNITYRPDIDGLRAIAVLGVLLFHLDPRLCPGGFTGVDVFFVISGYLITSIITREIQEKKFSLIRFYERRIRRILPAYFFLLLFTTTCAYLLLTPEALEQYGMAMSNSLLFISNFLFAEKIDYFAKTFNSSPLLHTWSLAVEEQFYLIWPLTMILFGKFLLKRGFKILLLSFLGASLLLSEILAAIEPKLAFFMIYARAWELGIGAVIALPYFPAVSSNKKVELLSRTGFLFILISLLLIDKDSRFPGFSASFAVLGTAAIIYSGKFKYQGYVHRLLCFQPLVFIGLISYSLYLWHWPLITFAKYYLDRDLNYGEIVILGFTSLFLAYFSYRFIETPFRKKAPPKTEDLHGVNDSTSQARVHQRRIFFGAIISTLLLLFVSVTVEKSKGLPSRFSELNQPDLYTGNPFRDPCHLSREETLPANSERCIRNYGKKKAILWGDSHADHYMPALDSWARHNNIQLRQISKSACVPIVGEFDLFRLTNNRYTKYEECKIVNEKIVQLIEEDGIETIILAGRWTHFFQSYNSERPARILLDSSSQTPDEETTERIFTDNFRQMISTFRKHELEVILLGQVPFFSKNPPECYLKEETPIKKIFQKSDLQTHDVCTVPTREMEMRLARSRQFFRDLNRYENVVFFDPLPYLCDNTDCKALQGGKILYHDTHHLNIEGARFLEPSFALDTTMRLSKQ